MLYYFDNQNIDEGFVECAEPLLSEQRKQSLNSLKALTDRINCCSTYLMLRYALAHEYGIHGLPLFSYIENQKPVLPDYPHIHFSFSHCKSGAACIVDNQNTAVDIMEIRPKNTSVWRRVCSEREYLELSSSSEPDRDFIRLWTLKECCSKLNGLGLRQDFRTLTCDLPEMRKMNTIEEEAFILTYYGEPTTPITVTGRILLAQSLRSRAALP